MATKRIAVLGGSGFVGRQLVAALTRAGHETRVLTRRRSRSRHLLVMPTCEIVETDVHRVSNLSLHLAGCDAAVNLAGILNEHAGPGGGFGDAHAELPGKLAEACRANHIGRMLHMSALGAGADAPSEYLRTKFRGEQAAHAAGESGVAVTSFRPSVIFGPGDGFFNRFAELLAFSPLVFPLACPEARFAPVYVGDVVRAFLTALGDDSTAGGMLRTVRTAHVHAPRAGRVHRQDHRPPAADRRAGRRALTVPGPRARAAAGQALQHRQLPVHEGRQRLLDQRAGTARDHPAQRGKRGAEVSRGEREERMVRQPASLRPP